MLDYFTSIPKSRLFFCVDPSAPENVQLVVYGLVSVCATWNPPPRPQGSVSGYLVYWFLDNVPHKEFFTSENRSCVYMNLNPGQNVSVVVSAIMAINNPGGSKRITRDSERVGMVIPHLNGKSFVPALLRTKLFLKSH